MAERKDGFPRYLKEAGSKEIVITKHRKSAGVLVGLKSEHDWPDCRLEDEPRFHSRIEAARQSIRRRRGMSLDEVD